MSTLEMNTTEVENTDAGTPSILLTLAAAEKVASLLAEENNPQLHFRVVINGGGCSGFQYVFSFDDSINDDDFVIEQRCSDGSSVQLLVDSISYQYLNQAEIDYVKNIQGEQFVIRNPNAKTTCGCGSSFSIDEDA
jgi:iron-sulfur cluster insertion protein